jgi:hypothetical protein
MGWLFCAPTRASHKQQLDAIQKWILSELPKDIDRRFGLQGIN